MESGKKFEAIEIIKNRLYFVSDKHPPRNQQNAYFFCIDQDLVYDSFFADFGPLNLGNTSRFVTELDNLLQDQTYSKYLIYHYTSLDTAKRANAAYLICAYQIIMLGRTAEQAWEPFKDVKPAFADFRDASYGPCTYKCMIIDCLRGLEYAIHLKWFDVKSFNLRDYEYYERVENGDLNVIIPEKFIAFSGPSPTQRDPDGYRTFTPEDYVPIFKQMGVTLVIRLNKKSYDASRFTKFGIKHLDLYFLDGSVPNPQICEKFFEAVENEPGKVAVHCKAGLGRTGTLIALYAMKHYRFMAADFIGWIRICRPGSILGPQQFFLLEEQQKYFQMSSQSTIWPNVKKMLANNHSLEARFQNLSIEDRGSESPDDLRKKQGGDQDQAQRLLQSKRQQQEKIQ